MAHASWPGEGPGTEPRQDTGDGGGGGGGGGTLGPEQGLSLGHEA